MELHWRLLSLIVIALVCGCGQRRDTLGETKTSAASSAKLREVSPGSPIQVTATVGMVADLVRNVGGQRLSVKQICGSGVDPHLYKTTRDDVLAIRRADIVFYSGLMLEGKMSDTLAKEARSRPVIAITKAIDKTLLLEPENFAGNSDPHVWMDVSIWSKCIEVIVTELSKIDPAAAELYRENGQAYQRELAKLHQYGVEAIASIPQESRVLVTSHDAFSYFGRAYGLEVLGVQGISTESEAGLQRINDLVALLVNRKVRSVFIESSVSSNSIEALVEGARSKGSEVKIVDKELFSDAMGQAGSYEGTYIGMLDHNITTVVNGLGGDAPVLGLNGKLKH